MSTYINHVLVLASRLAKTFFANTRVHAKLWLTNGYEFKQEFTSLLKGFNIKPVLTKIINPQLYAPVEQVHQIILNIIDTKDLDNKIFDHIDPWGELLASITWAIRASYHRTIMATLGQSVFDIEMMFNLTSVLY